MNELLHNNVSDSLHDKERTLGYSHIANAIFQMMKLSFVGNERKLASFAHRSQFVHSNEIGETFNETF